jgi:hypothetical protein
LIFLGYIVAKATIHKDPEVAVCMEIEDAELQRLKPRDHVRRVYPVVEATASQNQNTKRWLQGLKPRSQGFIFGGDETPPFRFRIAQTTQLARRAATIARARYEVWAKKGCRAKARRYITTLNQ